MNRSLFVVCCSLFVVSCSVIQLGTKYDKCPAKLKASLKYKNARDLFFCTSFLCFIGILFG